MALAVSIVDRTVFGDKRRVVADIDFDNSYETGGKALSPDQVGLKRVESADTASKSGYVVIYDTANSKLLAYYSGNNGNPLSEVSNGTNLSTLTGVRVTFYGY